jgi:hypothetical protein
MSRSHKITVPTARPPAAARKILYMWGRGEQGSALRSYLKRVDAVVEQDNEVARKLASAHGAPLGFVRETWALRVEGADAGEIDALTRDDPSVMGWTENPNETCAPSLALRNALNVLSRGEYEEVGATLVERFASPEHPHGEGLLDRWIARDKRIVYFDAEHSEWRLGDYVGT